MKALLTQATLEKFLHNCRYSPNANPLLSLSHMALLLLLLALLLLVVPSTCVAYCRLRSAREHTMRSRTKSHLPPSLTIQRMGLLSYGFKLLLAIDQIC